ncbi:MAG TPA: SUMF1/EgtB/PvdO family nonheme iron enzyme, partial [Vicingus sp.]|nr:SUMF1/EgtB/PvdO family nonheme iron enzyme [Vicingus sp.]
MKIKSFNLLIFILSVCSVFFLTSCKREQSGATGWEYNNPKNGGFQKVPYLEQETGPGLVLIEGGRFTMGRVEQEVNFDWNNIPRTVTVSSFYMDEVEVTNFFYLEYLYWLERVFAADYPEVIKKALPDTLVWRSK